MSKLLFVTPRMVEPAKGGREMLSRLHHDCLRAILGDRLVVYELDRMPISGVRATARALRGYVDGISPEVERTIVARIADEDIGRVLLDGSNLGRLAHAIRKSVPGTELFSFFCNVETDFFLDALTQSRRVHALGVLAANYVAERMAVRCSDRLITLSARDSSRLARLYRRSGTDVLPLAIEDQAGDRSGSVAEGDRDYLLFVGGAFFGNEAAVRWFVANVVPTIGFKFKVVGRGFERLRDELGPSERFDIVGGVADLAPYYRNAAACVAPIFGGSGMKTKVAEALMFGKKILGSSEAFAGYENVADRAGWICNSADEFIAAITRLEQGIPPAFDPDLRQLYEAYHSRAAVQRRLAEILAEPAP